MIIRCVVVLSSASPCCPLQCERCCVLLNFSFQRVNIEIVKSGLEWLLRRFEAAFNFFTAWKLDAEIEVDLCDSRERRWWRIDKSRWKKTEKTREIEKTAFYSSLLRCLLVRFSIFVILRVIIERGGAEVGERDRVEIDVVTFALQFTLRLD